MNYRDEQEIDLIDVCRQILKKWYVILAFMLVGLAVGSAAGYMRSAKTVDAETLKPVTSEENSAQNLETLKEKLSDKEVNEAEAAVDSYRSLKKIYSDRVKYGDNSIRMKIDSESVPTLTSSYVIDDYYEVTYPTIEKATNINNIVSIYSKKLYDDTVINEVREALGGSVAETYVKELYSVSLAGDSILNITVTARSKEECQSVMDVLTKYFESAIPDAKKHCAHSITYLETNYSRDVNPNLLLEQQAQADALAAIERNMLSLSTSLTADQKLYFNALINGEAESEVEDKESKTIVVRSFNIKYTALGAMAGAFLVIAFICAIYVLSQTIKTKDEISSLFGVNLLGVLNDKAEGEIGMIAAGAGLGSKKAKAGKIYITGSLSDETIKNIRTKVSDAIKKNYSDLIIDNGDSALTDPVSLSSLADADAVIIIEKLRKSKYDDIAKEIEIAKNYEVKVLGAVMVE